MINNYLLKIDKLNIKFFSDQEIVDAVSDVSISLMAGEILGIVGSSGSGKSTLCRALIGLLKIRGGQIKIYDRNLKTHNKKLNYLKKIQIIFLIGCKDTFDAFTNF